MEVKALTRTEYSVNFLTPSSKTQLTKKRSIIANSEFGLFS